MEDPSRRTHRKMDILSPKEKKNYIGFVTGLYRNLLFTKFMHSYFGTLIIKRASISTETHNN